MVSPAWAVAHKCLLCDIFAINVYFVIYLITLLLWYIVCPGYIQGHYKFCNLTVLIGGGGGGGLEVSKEIL